MELSKSMSCIQVLENEMYKYSILTLACCINIKLISTEKVDLFLVRNWKFGSSPAILSVEAAFFPYQFLVSSLPICWNIKLRVYSGMTSAVGVKRKISSGSSLMMQFIFMSLQTLEMWNAEFKLSILLYIYCRRWTVAHFCIIRSRFLCA